MLTKTQVKSRLPQDIVIYQGTAILKLLPSKDKTLLIRGDALPQLNLDLDDVNGIRRVDIKRDGLTIQSLDEDLHTSTKTKDHQVKNRLLLDVIFAQGASSHSSFPAKIRRCLLEGMPLISQWYPTARHQE